MTSNKDKEKEKDKDDNISDILHSYTSRINGIPGIVFKAIKRDGTVLYEESSGVKIKDQIISFDSIFQIASISKLITAVAALQLVEKDKIKLDDPAENYVPELANIKILKAFDSDDKPIYEEAKTKVTTRMLLSHTGGTGYAIFSDILLKFQKLFNIPIGGKKDYVTSVPLIHEPGTQWKYGNGTNWVGLIIEAVTGEKLGSYLQKNIFDPLEINSTSFSLSEEMISKCARVHTRSPDGNLTESRILIPSSKEIEFHSGGSGLYSTAPDLSKILHSLLNDGVGFNGKRIIKKETVDLLFEDQTTPMGIDMKEASLKAAIPNLVNEGIICPGIPKNYSFGGLRLESELPSGRSSGSVWWGGICNCYWWIDRQKEVAGILLSQVLPFLDPQVLECWNKCEQQVYNKLKGLSV